MLKLPNISYYCRTISVVLCKVSQPSRYKRKSYDENFVTAKCACINDGATLKVFIFNKKATCYAQLMNLSFGNRVPSSSKNPHFLNNAKCKTFHAGKSFIFMGLKHHFHNTFYYRGPAEGWHRSQNAYGPFFQRYIVRDISLTEIYCWLIEILSAILKRTRHGGQSRERL